MTGWDVVIVGGGTSGSVLAARLSESPHRRVLLLEAGPVPRALAELTARQRDAGRVPGADPDEPLAMRVPTALPGFDAVRGVGLGGSSAINGGVFLRPSPRDFARWGAIDPTWGFDPMLPLMRRIERDLDFGDDPVHGDRGPIPVSRTRADHPIAVAFTDAAVEAGHIGEPDKNAGGPPGVGPLPRNVEHGNRVHPGIAYLLPVLDRPNLAVVADAAVSDIEFDGSRVVGVRYRVAGVSRRATGAEVVLCAGAVESAHLLLTAGIGPAEELRRAGIEVRVDSPGVGSAFSDHPQQVLEWIPARTAPPPRGEWTAGALHTDEVEVLAALADPAGDGASIPMLVTDLRPRRTGRLRLDRRDPRRPPTLDYGADPADAAPAGLDRGVRLARELIAAMGGRLAAEPRRSSAFHTASTAPFGDANAPVDAEGRVRGVDGLRIADVSILPTPPSRGPAQAAVLVAERVADRYAD